MYISYMTRGEVYQHIQGRLRGRGSEGAETSVICLEYVDTPLPTGHVTDLFTASLLYNE